MSSYLISMPSLIYPPLFLFDKPDGSTSQTIIVFGNISYLETHYLINGINEQTNTNKITIK